MYWGRKKANHKYCEVVKVSKSRKKLSWRIRMGVVFVSM